MSTLTKIDGATKIATFTRADGEEVQSELDMIHVCPPQCAPTLSAVTPDGRVRLG